MSERLRAVIAKYLRDEKNGRTRLAANVGISTSTLDGYLGKRSKTVNPRPEIAYDLALACGCSEEEARYIQRECAPSAKETA